MAHVLVIPYPAPGHLLPTLDLCNQLALKGLTLTILITPKNLPLLQPLLSLHPSIQTLLFPFPSHPDLPSGIENMQELPISFIPAILSALSTFHDPLLRWSRSHSSPPVAMITDSFFTTWTHPLSCRLRIKNIAFLPFNAHGALGWWRALERRLNNFEHFLVEDHRVVDMVTWGVVLNSFGELEDEMLAHLRNNVVGHHRVWAVGPFLPLGNDPLSASKRCGSSSVPESEVLRWLNSCRVDRSAVYVGFGSQITLTENQMRALTVALEHSGVRFVLSVKDPMKGANEGSDSNGRADRQRSVIPDGFENRVAGRGLVIKGWAPQQAILQHRAVGSYLTHCGWNSAVEGLLAGVLLLAWPMQADHFDNVKLLVDQLGVAVRVCEGLETVPDSDRLAEVLADSVSAGSEEKRSKAMELGKQALNAAKHGGSSDIALDDFVKKLSA